MRPSEWERHTGCRKKKWKESIRVKNLEQPLVSWVSCLASSFVSNFILAIVLRFYIWKGLSFLCVLYSGYAEGEQEPSPIYLKC